MVRIFLCFTCLFDSQLDFSSNLISDDKVKEKEEKTDDAEEKIEEEWVIELEPRVKKFVELISNRNQMKAYLAPLNFDSKRYTLNLTLLDC